jgi:hypothetical protein
MHLSRREFMISLLSTSALLHLREFYTSIHTLRSLSELPYLDSKREYIWGDILVSDIVSLSSSRYGNRGLIMPPQRPIKEWM